MEAVSVTSSFLPSLSKSGVVKKRSGGGKGPVWVSAALRRRNSYGSGREVDEGMIVLRKRIHELKVIERNYQPPADWMDWEKQMYASYDDLICRSIAVLQSLLLDSRPSVGFTILALLAAGVPTSVALLVLQILATGH